jgi:mannose-1-phosphate guanylyltransferase/mannose-6-phosphate isomerase
MSAITGIDPFIIAPNATIVLALQKIDANRKGFLIVADERGDKLFFMGTLTDGDIRRALINGTDTKQPIEKVYKRDSKTANTAWTAVEVLETFKDVRIGFLPVVDADNELVNIITKKQVHTLTLTNQNIDLSCDFSGIDESLIDYEIFPRPWGFYKTTVMNEHFQSKVITVYPGASLSLQMHNRREEYWIVAYGTGTAQIDESQVRAIPGSTLFIPKGCKHRLINTSSSENLILTELQLGDYFGEDDIVRFEDVYGRA